MKKFLITGIPGMGKTEIGDYLAKKHNFLHLDMEDRPWPQEFKHLNQFPVPATQIMNLIKQLGKATVLTWGFDPVGNREEIQELILNGATIIWFDGDRKLALESWKKSKGRNLPNDDLFHIQINRIESSNIITILNPIQYNTFNVNGVHKPHEEIAADLFNMT